MDEVSWQQVAERVWRTQVDPHQVTCGLVAGEDHCLLVDTGSDPEQGRRIAASAAKVAGRPVDRVVITHHHDDHVGGLGGLDPSVESWMHRSASARCGATVTHPLSLMAFIDLGGLGAEVLHLGPGHTDGDLVVHVPDRGVTFTGDLVETSGDPQCDESSDPWGWAQVLDALLSATRGRGRYLPGHGDPVDAQQVLAQRQDIGRCVEDVREAMSRGHDAETIAARAADGGHDWPFGTEALAQWIPRTAQVLLDRELVRPRQLDITAVTRPQPGGHGRQRPPGSGLPPR